MGEGVGGDSFQLRSKYLGKRYRQRKLKLKN